MGGGGQHVQEGAIVLLDEAVTLRMLGGRPGLLKPQGLAYFSDQVRLKLSTLVQVQLREPPLLPLGWQLGMLPSSG
jgi:hypothetical protein